MILRFFSRVERARKNCYGVSVLWSFHYTPKFSSILVIHFTISSPLAVYDLFFNYFAFLVILVVIRYIPLPNKSF